MSERRGDTILILGASPGVLEGWRHVSAQPIDSLVNPVPLDTRALIIAKPLEEPGSARLLRQIKEALPTLRVFGLTDGHFEFSPSLLALLDRVYRVDQLPLLRREIYQDRAHTMGAWLSAASAFAWGAASVALVGLIWAYVTLNDWVPPYLLPPPQTVWEVLLRGWSRLLFHFGVTAGEATGGFVVGNAAAFLAAVVLHRFNWLRRASLPLLVGLQALPIIALAPLLTVWLGTGVGAKICMSAIVCFFPVVANLLASFRSIDPRLQELFEFHRASYRETLRRLLLPGSLPALGAALRTSGGLAVVGAVVAEFTGSDQGLGFLLLNAAYRSQTDVLIAAVILTAVLGLVFASVPSFLLGRVDAFREAADARGVG